MRELSKTAETTQEVVQQARPSLQFFHLFSEKKLVVHTGEESTAVPAVAMFHIHGYVLFVLHS